MAETKRYYWIKLKEDFFQDDAISWIEEQKDGKECCLFYLKLCLKSLRNQGVLVRYIGDSLIQMCIRDSPISHSKSLLKCIYGKSKEVRNQARLPLINTCLTR